MEYVFFVSFSYLEIHVAVRQVLLAVGGHGGGTGTVRLVGPAVAQPLLQEIYPELQVKVLLLQLAETLVVLPDGFAGGGAGSQPAAAPTRSGGSADAPGS